MPPKGILYNIVVWIKKRREIYNLASTILLRIESTSRQLERVAPSRLGGTIFQL